MEKDVKTINLDTDLRRHLLFGSVGLAIAVLIVFINVTLHLASDLGESIESGHIKSQVEKISVLVKDIVDSGQLTTLENEQKIPEKFFSRHSYYIDNDVVSFNIWVAGQMFSVKNDKTFTNIPEIQDAITQKIQRDGFIKVDGERFFWIYKYITEDNCELLFIRKVYALDRAIEYMTTRLSISAFLTFWLAVWVALILSALITRRFVRGNVRLNYLANHDMLTQLPNRAHLHEVINRYLTKMSSSTLPPDENRHKAFIFLIDLNKFKEVNDTMGHHTGDILLQSIAIRLRKLVDENTHAFRYGGDEFIIWQEKSNQGAAAKLAEDVLQLFRQPMRINNAKFEISASIGIACCPEDGETLNDLFRHADIAMYHAKRLRLGYQNYQASLESRSALRVNLSGQLNHALTHEQFVLYYQPKVRLNDGKIFGVEALVRWQHPTEGLLAPDLFIHIIEQSDFVHEFTRYIFKKAILQCKYWLDKNIKLSVAVNISPYNLMDTELISFLRQQLTLHQVPAQLIEVELTESATMVGIETTQKVFSQLKELGVKLSIDDFGTGMSSLAYIKELNVDYIKIDRSFVENINVDTKDEAIIMSILLLCEKLEREVIIEGVETEQQKDKLIELGCQFAQGYFFGKPMPIEVLTPQLASMLLTKTPS
jgi:diguanylate cyclase (GGDEF)-like protein